MKWLNKYFNFLYFFKLIGLTVALNYCFIALNGIVSPGGFGYNSFIDEHLNLIHWIRYSIMYVSNIIAHSFGIASYISGPQMINIGTDIEVEMWLPCLGLGIIGFWTAFIVINTGTWRKKLFWYISGVFFITFINCWRVGLLLISLDRSWPQSKWLDHHDIFNIAAYVSIGLLMYSYSENKEPEINESVLINNIKNKSTESLV